MTRIIISIVACLLLTISLKSQEGIYYYGSNMKPVLAEEEWLHLVEITRRPGSRFMVKSYSKTSGDLEMVQKERIKILDQKGSQRLLYSTGRLLPGRIDRKMNPLDPDLYQFTESSSGSIIRKGMSSRILPLHLDGEVTTYYRNGRVQSISQYKDNQLITNQNWLPDGSEYIDSIFYDVDKEPEYQMGDKFFKSFLLKKLTESQLDFSQIQGTVNLSWVIMEDGALKGIQVNNSRSQQLNELLIDIVTSLPGYWTPAILNGSQVRFYKSIPLNFHVEDVRFQEIDFSGGVMHYSRY